MVSGSPDGLIETALVYGWDLLNLLLPVLFAIRAIQTPSWENLAFLALIFLLPGLTPGMSRRNHTSGRRLLGKILTEALQHPGRESLDEHSPAPDWAALLEKHTRSWPV